MSLEARAGIHVLGTDGSASADPGAVSPALEILVVEDEPAVLRMLCMGLEMHGLQVCPARSGEEALELMRRRRDRIGAILLDVQMPGGLDGPQTLVMLRQIDADVPCCFMSGSTGVYTTDDLTILGATRILPKPFPSIANLARMLWQVARPVA